MIDTLKHNDIERDMYSKFSLLHPVYAIDGHIDQELMIGNTTTKILTLDRNVLQYLLKAVKKGSFDGEYRKALTVLSDEF